MPPVTHAGVHLILAISYRQGTSTLEGQALLWSDFMPPVGPLRPPELFHHDPARDVPTADARHVPHAGGVLDQTQYHNLWCYRGTRDPRITCAYPDVDVFNLDLGAYALLDPMSAQPGYTPMAA
ncbi:MAG: hypothetical protein ABIZ05_01500 [Pseudonocardiaceae bacterium]